MWIAALTSRHKGCDVSGFSWRNKKDEDDITSPPPPSPPWRFPGEPGLTGFHSHFSSICSGREFLGISMLGMFTPILSSDQWCLSTEGNSKYQPQPGIMNNYHIFLHLSTGERTGLMLLLYQLSATWPIHGHTACTIMVWNWVRQLPLLHGGMTSVQVTDAIPKAN